MMMSNAMYRVRTPTVVSDNIDGEVVALHLTHGHYYSMGGPAALIWGWIEAGASRQTIETRLAEMFEGPEEPMREAVSKFLGRLVEEGLIEETHEAPSLIAAAAPGSNGEPRRPFEPPLVERYTDMQDLLVLDPIHDVGETGWPTPKDS